MFLVIIVGLLMKNLNIGMWKVVKRIVLVFRIVKFMSIVFFVIFLVFL